MSSPVIAAVLLLVSAGVIYAACEWFVNGVEWVGRRLGVAQSAVGSILAAFGTALPESVVTFVAVVFGRDAAARDIGVGAALGGPLVLATIGYAIVGITMIAVRPGTARWPLGLDDHRLGRDQGWFLVIFAFKLLLGFFVFAIKPWLGLLFLLAYAVYFWIEVRREEDQDVEELEPLKLQPRRETPALAAALLQTAAALVVIFLASELFVAQLGAVGPWLGIPPAVVALLLSPIATELPETMNAIIWIRQGKHRMAMSNISGSMMIQATIPSALGIGFTPWLFSAPLAAAGVVTALAILLLWTLLKRGRLTALRLALLGLFYVLFAVGLIWLR